jgi:hypothetical protein
VNRLRVDADVVIGFLPVSFLVNSLPIEAAFLLFKKEIFYRESAVNSYGFEE